ncbi:DUF4233 domain-containing protein [Rugosimonospora africana]|uniref:DUF4233 domain-containing protein n=1 Tax=Rugosimonospora africana TaxID=556532 RepID=A0A8J3VVH7_9ACTN|nr:DUF4233 domain-containing protein [Rugosimonospora africana]GIH19944.1 hypothetical protein Raf01_81160 [Rugosimonospora africana]
MTAPGDETGKPADPRRASAQQADPQPGGAQPADVQRTNAQEIDGQPADGQPAEAQQVDGSDGEGPRSGLRNPAGAVRGVGAGTLVLEAIVLLLAIVPLTKLGGVHSPGAAIGAVLGLVVLCVVLAGLLRHRWAWYAGIVLQVALFACGLFHIALAVLGVLFGAVWGYVLYVRRSVTG